MNLIRRLLGCFGLIVSGLSAGELRPGALPPAAVGYARDSLLADLSRELGTHFNLEGELQLDLVRPWPAPARKATAWTLQVVEFPAAPSASMLVRCRLIADTASAGEFSLILRAALWRDAWVARQPLAVGAAFDASLVEPRRTDVLRERDALPVTAGDRSYVIARAVPTGRLLGWRDLSRRPLVRKGELVEVSAIDGSLVVTLKAQAMESGAQGDTVTLRNPESRRNFSATVINENRVQVRF
jgi:flagella basal body P-ring formation protein FlgA